tara:strand:+ start:26 stop:271 length:246 start_codon:yes stop_codon:yes gene_type:complete
MKGYKSSKAAGKNSLSSEDGIVYLVRKRYDIDTGAELSDDKMALPSTKVLQERIDTFKLRIDAITKEKEDYEQLKTDIEAL